MRKSLIVLSLILVFCITMPMIVMAKDTIYKDVGYNKWYSRSVLFNKQTGVMQGDYFGFRPNDNITRAEFVTILSRLAKADIEKYTEAAFDDAPIDAWYGKVIAWAKENELVDGYSATLFGPDDPITREQMCVILANFIEKYSVSLPVGEEKTFADGDEISKWAKDAVAKCAKRGVVSGMEKNMFCPADTATRAQVSQLMFNFQLNVDEENSAISMPQGNIPSAPPLYHIFLYYSFDEFAAGIKDLPSDAFEVVNAKERSLYSLMAGKTNLTDEEFENGTFPTFVKKICEENEILYPCIKGEEGIYDSIVLTPYAADRFGETEICYKPDFETGESCVTVEYFEPELCEEAREKGTAWFFAAVDKTEMTPDNYQEIKDEMISLGYTNYEGLKVYEKEYTLYDGTVVKALVYDWTEARPAILVYFVYDDALIALSHKPELVDDMISNLSFVEKSFN